MGVSSVENAKTTQFNGRPLMILHTTPLSSLCHQHRMDKCTEIHTKEHTYSDKQRHTDRQADRRKRIKTEITLVIFFVVVFHGLCIVSWCLKHWLNLTRSLGKPSSNNNTYIWTCQHSMRSHCCLKVELRIQALSDQIKITISYLFGRRGPFFLLRGRLRFIMSCTGCESIYGPRASTCRGLGYSTCGCGWSTSVIVDSIQKPQ